MASSVRFRFAICALLACASSAHAAERRAPAPQLSDRFPLREVIGMGGAKRVYATDDPKLAVRVGRAELGLLAEVAWFSEQRSLATLKAHGFPVLEPVARGTIDGMSADVVERFSRESAKQSRTFFETNGHLLASARKDLLQIRSAVLNGAAIIDLDILVKPGRAVVFDPIAVVLRTDSEAMYEGIARQNLELIDRLLSYEHR